MGGIHTERLRALDGVRISGVYDINNDAAKTLADNAQTRAYNDLDVLLNAEKPDAVYICLPPFAHNGEAEKCARYGAALFLEKPLALTVNRAESICDAVSEAGVISLMGYHQRYGGAVKKLKDMIDDGTAGKPCLFDARYACKGFDPPWWRDISKSGGQVLEQVSHTYDMASYLFGEPVSVMGMMANIAHKQFDSYTIEDVSASVARFTNESIMSISATNCAVPMRWDNPFYVVCENLTANFEDPNHAEFIYTNDIEVHCENLSFENDLYATENEYFVECLRSNTETFCPVSEGLNSFRFVMAVIESARKSKQINLK